MQYKITQNLEGAEYFLVDADSLEEAEKKYLENSLSFNGFDRYVQDADMYVEEIICNDCGNKILRGGVFWTECGEHKFRCEECKKKLE